jgi:hypothetical protein
VRELIPKESMATERVEGIDQIMADAVAGKFIPADNIETVRQYLNTWTNPTDEPTAPPRPR